MIMHGKSLEMNRNGCVLVRNLSVDLGGLTGVDHRIICYNMSIRLEKRDIFCLGKQKWISG